MSLQIGRVCEKTINLPHIYAHSHLHMRLFSRVNAEVYSQTLLLGKLLVTLCTCIRFEAFVHSEVAEVVVLEAKASLAFFTEKMLGTCVLHQVYCEQTNMACECTSFESSCSF